MKRTVAVALSWFALAGTAAGEDLLAVYEAALQNDPQIREADANRLATRESKPQALSALLPQISGTGSRSESETDGTRIFVQEDRSTGNILNFRTQGVTKPETTQWSLDLRQNIFSWDNWVQLQRANREVAQAEADFAAAEQDLIQRVAIRYFDVLAAQDDVDAETAAQESILRQLEQADKRFEVGLIAITDVQEARAARDAAAAAVIAAKRRLATAQELLREFTNAQYARLDKPGTDMPLKTPDPADAERWVELAMNQNLALISSRLASDIARSDVRSAFSGHLPTLDLRASKSHTKTDSTQTFAPNPPLRPNEVTVPIGNETDDEFYALEVNVPIFSGGFTRSRVRESQYRWIAAKERVVRVSRETERLARDAYLGVISEIARVTALRQSLESSQTALKAQEAGYEVGTRTAVDVLNSRRLLVQAQTNYARSRYDYILNVIQLRLASGNLDRDTLNEVNTWLSATRPTPAAP